MRARILLLFPLLGAVCDPPQPDAGPRVECFVGERGAAPEMELAYRTVDGDVAVLADGGEVPLILPPQGGKVILVGFRARNVDLCDLAVRASVHDTCTATDGNDGRVVGLEGRPVTLIEGDDGWGVPEDPHTLNNWANIPLCPNNAFTRDIDGQPYLLRVRMIERSSGRATTSSATITPVCAEPEALAECDCTCDADYFLGAACGDAGPGSDDDVNDPPPGACPVAGGGDAGVPDGGTTDAGP